jgi:alginate O-acetyltransferase complex protein AlgI
MIYSNPEFFLLLTATWLLYRFLPSPRARFAVLLGASVFFYSWAGVFDSLIFLFVVTVSWTAVWLARRKPATRSWAIPAGITVMALHLFFWKYASWAVGQIQLFAPGFLGGRRPVIPLPVGISFFTLQGIAYLVDFRRGEAEFMGLKEYLLFKSFFAQLIAGPIVRAHQLLPQLRRLERPTADDFACGVGLFAMGFFKKVVLADRVALFVDPIFGAPGQWGRAALATAVAGYTVQIWADFSGYTDMGRGCARMLGFRLPENFLSPYLARRPSEFWKRWHITLSEWIRDYVYIPLGGSRGNPVRALAVVIITMSLSGLWHGANWTFVVWGLYHGVLLVTERLAPDVFAALPRLVADFARRLLMLAATAFGWLLFRAPDLASAGRFLRGMLSGGGQAPMHARNVWPAVLICAGLQILLYQDLETGRRPLWEFLGRRWSALSGDGRSEWAPAAGFAAGCALAGVIALSIALRSPHARAFIYFAF